HRPAPLIAGARGGPPGAPPHQLPRLRSRRVTGATRPERRVAPEPSTFTSTLEGRTSYLFRCEGAAGARRLADLVPNDPLHDEADVARLRRALALARLWLATFANPKSFVWSEGGDAPHQIASAALAQVTAELTRNPGGVVPAYQGQVADANAARGQSGA